jgi:UDP-N-acetylglucosamine 2-epimerase (non-hydrolysing)
MLLSAHREENIDNEANFISLFTSINRLARKYQMPILYSCHPRSMKFLKARGFELDELVRIHEPMSFTDYNRLQQGAFCVISDSGTLPEESSFYASVGKPISAVCIRTSTERPEAMEKGCFVLAGIDGDGVEQAVELAVSMRKDGEAPIPVPCYTEPVSNKVVSIIQSYTSVVNKMVWRKK